MHEMQKHVEFRIMPSGNGRSWYWEVIHDTYSIMVEDWQTPNGRHAKKQPTLLVKRICSYSSEGAGCGRSRQF